MAHAGKCNADTHASKLLDQGAASKATTARLNFPERRNSVNLQEAPIARR